MTTIITDKFYKAPSSELPFSGISFFFSKPSRFDDKELLSGHAGIKFKDWLTRCGFLVEQCEFRLCFDERPLIQGTKVIMLLGRESLQRIFPHEYSNASLNELRGNLIEKNGIIYIPSYSPQDAFDIKNFEGTLNSSEKYYSPEDVESMDGVDEDKKDKTNGKGHGKTSRANWKFWLENDLKKVCRIARSGKKYYINDNVQTIYYPPASEVIDELKGVKNSFLYFDIETLPPEFVDISVFGFKFKDSNFCFSVPIHKYNGELGYSVTDLSRILQALAIAFRDNCVVIHNAMYDLMVMAWRYKIPPPPINNIFCTMISAQRIHPEVEKSLGHSLSLYCDVTYHKNDGTLDPKNYSQEQSLHKYNAADIITLELLHSAIIEKATKLNNMESLVQANRSIRPYLTMQLLGVNFDDEIRQKKISYADKRANQFLRVLRILSGRDLNPGSPKQMQNYFYRDLSLKFPGRGKVSCDSGNLIKLYIKQDCPSIPVVMEIRRILKESEKLRFNEYKLI